MAQKKSYSRYFIILQEDEKGYSLASDKIASGYAKLETKNDKCKISYYVQNLKKDKTPYYMILICNKKDIKKMINIGEMNIDDYGRADISYEYPVSNISNSGVSIDKVSGAAIVRILDNNIISVMSGFASMDIPEWKSFSMVKDKTKINSKPKPKQDENKKSDDKIKKMENKSIFDKYEENIEAQKDEDNKSKEAPKKEDNKDKKESDKKETSNKQKEKLDKSEKKNSNIKVKKSNQFTNKILDLVEDEDKKQLNKFKDISDTREDSEDEKIYIDSSSMEINKDYRVHGKNSEDNFFESLVEGLKETSNISQELKRCKWYKVPTVSMQNVYNINDYNKYTFIYYPMTSYYNYIGNYSHFLIGYKYDRQENVKYIIYGIPGSKNKKEQPYGGRSGFVTWIPEKDNDERGYWLMFYDFRSGTVDIPIKDNNK